MSSALKRFLALLPSKPRLIGDIYSAEHPQYQVVLVGGGVVACTSQTEYAVGARVFIEGNEVISGAPEGSVITVEV